MSTVVIITGNPLAGSATEAVQSVVAIRVRHSGHGVLTLALRELPARALIDADLTDPDVARALAAVDTADGVVVLSPVSTAAYSGLLKVFLDALPASALRGKPVLPVLSGDSPAQAAVVDYALRPVLAGLGADGQGRGGFVLEGHLRSYANGGVVLDEASALPLAEATDAFLAALERQSPGTPLPRPTGRVSPVAGAPDLTVVQADPNDPVLAPLLRDLMVEYTTRYGGPSPYTTLTEVPTTDFVAPDGAFLALTEDGETIAGGALRRYDEHTAEVKRVWTSSRHRRRGLARRLMAELEKAAAELGYCRVHLTTGKRQPEAVALYLAAGYLPRFDLVAEQWPNGTDSGPLAFGKELRPGAGLVEWVDPPAGAYYRIDEQAAREAASVSVE